MYKSIRNKQIIFLLCVALIFFISGCSKRTNISTKQIKNKKYNLINSIKLVVPGKPAKKEQSNKKNARNIKLVLKSVKANEVIDEENWFKKNDLSLPFSSEIKDEYGTRYKTPEKVPDKLKGIYLNKVIFQKNGYIAIYGEEASSRQYLLFFDRKFNIKNALDFSNYYYTPDYLPEGSGFSSPGIDWAVEEKNILYISSSYDDLGANTKKGVNARITAIDLSNSKIIWQTDGLVSNANNFAIIKDIIVSGYGYTDIPDYLYLMNKHTGKVIEKILLRTAPEYLILKNNLLYVRTYDTDYVFKIIN